MTEPRRTDWTTVFLSFGAGIAAAFQIGKAPIALPLIRADFGLSLAAASWVLAALTLVGALMGGLIGSLVSRWGPHRILAPALALLGLASLAGGLAPSHGLLLLSRVVEGLGLTLVVIAAPSVISFATQPGDRHAAFGLWACFMPAGMALAMMAAPLLDQIGWRGLWLGMAGLLLGYAGLVLAVIPHPPAAMASPTGRLWRDLRRTLAAPGPVLLALIFMTYTTCYLALTGFLPTLLIERMQGGPGLAGMMTAGVAAANIVGNLATGPLLGRGVPRWMPIVTACLTIAVTAPVIFDPQSPGWLAYGLCLLFSMVGGLLPGCVLGGGPAYAPRPSLVPVTLGLIMQGSNLGQVVGPILIGTVVAQWGWPAAGPVMVAAMAIGVGLTLVLRRIPPRA